MAAENPDLPEEILVDIFSRLPTKSVGRCRCLSKSWRSNLFSTDFIKKHLITRQKRIHPPNLALTTPTSDSLYIVTSPLQEDEEQVKIFCGEPLGTCNGLVLLFCERDLILWNPITLQQVNIRYSTHLSCTRKVYGFGYDCHTDDFKVVLFCSYCGKNKKQDNKGRVMLHVFSLRKGVWNSLANTYPYGGDLIPSINRPGAFVNGALHWSICERNSDYLCHIAAFDLANELFYELPIPTEIDTSVRGASIFDKQFYNGLAVIGGCLTIVDNLGNGATDFWMMKEYGVAES